LAANQQLNQSPDETPVRPSIQPGALTFPRSVYSTVRLTAIESDNEPEVAVMVTVEDCGVRLTIEWMT
jgi:hypothetical protein